MSEMSVLVERHLDIADGVNADLVNLGAGRYEGTLTREIHILCRRLSPATTYHGWVRCAGTEHHFAFGSTLFMPADVDARFQADWQQPMRALMYSVSPERFCALTGLHMDWDRARLTRSLDLRDPLLDEALLRLVDEMHAPGFASALVTESIANLLIAYLARALAQQAHARMCIEGGLAPWQMRRITEYVEDSEDARPTLPKLADLCGVSRGHLTRAFKRTTGRTVHAYIEQVQLRKAMDLLRHDKLSVKQVAATLGFANQSSFAQAFHRLTGRTPSDYRRWSATTRCETTVLPRKALLNGGVRPMR